MSLDTVQTLPVGWWVKYDTQVDTKMLGSDWLLFIAANQKPAFWYRSGYYISHTILLIFNQATDNETKYALITIDDDIDGNTLLHLAAASGQCDMVKFLLSIGRSLQLPEDTEQHTSEEEPDVISELLSTLNRKGYTPILEAVECGKLRALKVLLDSFSNREEKNEALATECQGRNALQMAYMYQEMEVYDFIIDLLKNDENKITHMTAGQDEWSSLLQYAAKHKEVDFLCDAAKQVSPENRAELFPDNIIMSVLEAALKTDNLTLARLVLECQSKSRHQEIIFERFFTCGYQKQVKPLGNTFLQLCAIETDVSTDILLYLLSLQGSKDLLREAIVKLNGIGETSLHLAASVGNTSFFREILVCFDPATNSGFMSSTENKLGKTVFHVAAKHDKLPELKLLFNLYGPTETAQIFKKCDRAGNSLLHSASRRLQITEFLLTLCPSSIKRQCICLPNKDGNTAAHLAGYNNPQVGIMKTMMKHLQPRDRIELLCLPNKTGRTPIHLAAYHGTGPFYGLLDNLGDTSEVIRCFSSFSNEGNTPLDRAINNCNPAALIDLLSLFDTPSLMALVIVGKQRQAAVNTKLHDCVQTLITNYDAIAGCKRMIRSLGISNSFMETVKLFYNSDDENLFPVLDNFYSHFGELN